MARWPEEVIKASQARDFAESEWISSISRVSRMCEKAIGQHIPDTGQVTRSQEKPALYLISAECGEFNQCHTELF